MIKTLLYSALLLGIMLVFPAGNSKVYAGEDAYIYTWSTNVEEAIEEAQGDEDDDAKHVFLYFAGSDWCPHCMEFEKKVLNTFRFRRFARKKLVPVLIDSPRQREISEEQKAYNDEQLAVYSVEGFPTILILDSEGNVLSRTGYQKNGVGAFLKELKEIIDS